MKTLSLVLVLAMLLTMCSFAASAEGEYTQAPYYDASVEAGELPPLKNVSLRTPA